MTEFRNEEYIMPEEKTVEDRARQIGDADYAFGHEGLYNAPNSFLYAMVAIAVAAVIGLSFLG